MFKFFGKPKDTPKIPAGANIINVKDVPLTAAGEPDIAAILAANGFTDIDISKVKIIKTDKTQ